VVTPAARLLGAGAFARLSSTAVQVWLLALFLDAGAIVVFLGPLQRLPRFAGHGDIPWPLLIIFFFLSEVLVVHLEVRRSAHTYSLSEIPTVMALFFAGPSELVVCRVVGSALALVLIRRNNLVKLAFNLGLFAWETSIAVWFFRTIVQGSPPVSPLGWSAALLAMVAFSVTAVVLINIVIALHQGRATFLQLGEALTLGVTVTVVNSCLALLFVTVLWHQPESAWLMVVPFAALYFAYRSAQSERRRRKSITHLYNLGRELQGSVRTASVIDTVTSHALDMFNAAWVEVLMAPEISGGPWRRASQAEAGEAEGLNAFSPESSDVWWFRQMMNSTDGAANRQDGVHNPYLASRGQRRVLVTNLRGEAHSLGLLLIARREVNFRWFDSEETRLLETLASQASAALETTRLAEQLRAAEAVSTRLGRIIDESPSDVYLVESGSLQLVQANRAATQRLGYTTAEMLGMTLADLLYGGDREVLEAQLAPLRQGRQQEVLLDASQRRRDGTSYPVEARIQVTQSTEPELLLVLSQDVTERNEALEARQESREKSRFLAAMSHELRTPLNSILGFSQLLLTDRFGSLTEKQTRYVDNVASSGQHLLLLINDLLDLSKVQAGKMDVTVSAVELFPVLEESAARMNELADAKGLQLDVAGAADLIVLADPLRLRQIILNLLSNAIKFTDAGSVRIVATASGEEVRLDVTDTGVGIDAEDLERMFEEFTQAKSGRSKSAQGTGLGLPISKRLAELMGGRIEVASKVGEGTTFSLFLPAAAEGELDDEPRRVSAGAR
jgi:PAS domain S-box-containing protein